MQDLRRGQIFKADGILWLALDKPYQTKNENGVDTWAIDARHLTFDELRDVSREGN